MMYRGEARVAIVKAVRWQWTSRPWSSSRRLLGSAGHTCSKKEVIAAVKGMDKLARFERGCKDDECLVGYKLRVRSPGRTCPSFECLASGEWSPKITASQNLCRPNGCRYDELPRRSGFRETVHYSTVLNSLV